MLSVGQERTNDLTSLKLGTYCKYSLMKMKNHRSDVEDNSVLRIPFIDRSDSGEKGKMNFDESAGHCYRRKRVLASERDKN